jgi:hypothetical protein
MKVEGKDMAQPMADGQTEISVERAWVKVPAFQ